MGHCSASPGNGNLPAGPDAASTPPFVFGTAPGQPSTCRAAQLGSPDASGLAEPGSATHVNAAVAQAQRRGTHRSRARRGAASASVPSAAPGVMQCLDVCIKAPVRAAVGPRKNHLLNSVMHFTLEQSSSRRPPEGRLGHYMHPAPLTVCTAYGHHARHAIGKRWTAFFQRFPATK